MRNEPVAERPVAGNKPTTDTDVSRTAVSQARFRTQYGSDGPGVAGGSAGPDDDGADDAGPGEPPTCGPSSHPTTTQPATDLA